MGKNRWVPILVGLVGLAIMVELFLYSKQYHGYEPYLVTNIAGLFWLPMVMILLVIRQEPSSFGFAFGEGRGYKIAGLLFLGLFPLLLIASRLPDFTRYYPMWHQDQVDLSYFWYVELTYGMYLFCWEFFFRGFLLFGLARLIGPWSVFVQAVAFGIMHSGKPGPEFLVSFVAGIILGVLALRSKSFAPCFVLHWVAATVFDVLVTLVKPGGVF